MNGPLAVIAGGPLHGAVYYVADLELRRRAHERIHPGEPFELRQTRETTPWVLDVAVDCQVWRCR